MLFHLIKASGKVTPVNGGCFGCLGRTDSYRAQDSVFESVKEINLSSGHSYSSSNRCTAYSDSDPAVFLELRKGWHSESGIGLHSLKTRQAMDYLVNRSPWKSVFACPLDEMYEKDTIKMHAQGVSSELVISAGFVLRALDYTAPHLTFKAVTDAAPDLPEFFRFFVSLVSSDLYRGGSQSRFGSYDSDGTIFPSDIYADAVLNPDAYLESTLSGISLEDAHGYVMNITGMWRGSKGKSVRSCFERAARQNSGSFEVQGVFGKMSLSGVHNLNKFCTDLYEDLRGK